MWRASQIRGKFSSTAHRVFGPGRLFVQSVVTFTTTFLLVEGEAGFGGLGVGVAGQDGEGFVDSVGFGFFVFGGFDRVELEDFFGGDGVVRGGGGGEGG